MAGKDAFGTALMMSDMESSPTFTEVANVTSISGPGVSRSTIDVTAHDSPNAWMEFIGSLKDAGEISLEVNWDPSESTHADLWDAIDDTDPRDWRIELPNNLANWELSGILTAFEPDYPTDDKITASITIKLSGQPELDIGS